MEKKVKHGQRKVKVYGYARVSTKTQSIDRQIENIQKFNDNAIIYQEKFTGTKLDGRREFQKLLKKVKQGDTIIFDSVSRMSRNAEEGIQLYMELFNKGIELIFLKERHIDTETYRKQLEQTDLPTTDNAIVNLILDGVKKALMELAKEQIKIAFNQSEKEVMDLRVRTSEGMKAKKKQALANGEEWKCGIEKGTKLVTKKSIEKKEQIKKYCKDFGGTLNDKDTMKLIGIARNTYYKYKKELLEEVQ